MASFKDIIGQEQIKEHMQNAILMDKVSHAYMIQGELGAGKEFMNEIVNRSHQFSRENFLDRRGRHRVYGIIRMVDQTLDELAQELVKDEKDNLAILAKIGEIRGLLLDIFT